MNRKLYWSIVVVSIIYFGTCFYLLLAKAKPVENQTGLLKTFISGK